MGKVIERRNHIRYLAMTPMADCFDCADSSGEAVWGIQCLWIEHFDVKRILRRMTIWWHGVGAKPRLAATFS
jgi:hypothetical protein